MNTYGEKLLSMRMIQIKSNKKQVLLLMINAFLEAFEFEAGVSVIRIAPPWFLSCTTRCKFTSLVPLLDLSWTTCCTTFVPFVVNLPLLYHSCTSLVRLLYNSLYSFNSRQQSPSHRSFLCSDNDSLSGVRRQTISCCNVCWLQQLII